MTREQAFALGHLRAVKRVPWTIHKVSGGDRRGSVAAIAYIKLRALAGGAKV